MQVRCDIGFLTYPQAVAAKVTLILDIPIHMKHHNLPFVLVKYSILAVSVGFEIVHAWYFGKMLQLCIFFNIS